MQSNNERIDFENLEIAFKDKSNAQLRQANMLFKVMNNAGMVKVGKHMVNLAFSIHFPIKGIIRNTIYKHFVGGVSIEDCSKTIENLAKRNVGIILDYAMEGEESEELFDATCAEIIRTIEFAHQNKNNVPFSAFKITGIGRFVLLAKKSDEAELSDEETEELERVYNRVDSIFRKGHELGVPVLIDAEHSWIQPYLDKLVLEMMEKYNKEKAIVQNTYQMYRHDSCDRIKEHLKHATDKGVLFGLKIVRGAYMEIERTRAELLGYNSPIHPNKPATDKDFDNVIRHLIQQIDKVNLMVATHNEESTQLLVSKFSKFNLPVNHPNIYFSQLYGMSDHITFNLAAKGFNVVKYVPYGEVKTMMPYLFRRAEENSSMRGQTSRELQFIKQEIKRRRNVKLDIS